MTWGLASSQARTCGVLVGGVAVHDQVKLDALAGVRVGGVAVGPVDLSQEGAELLVAVPGPGSGGACRWRPDRAANRVVAPFSR